ncbi:MAG: Uma2 family endonuclease [Leptospiraceae bacterium]|nr:Uma2 family endonuclease [Leptospiraceae bacterium]
MVVASRNRIPSLFNRAVLLNTEQYHVLCQQFPELEKTELIEGHIVKKMTISPEHSYLLESVIDILKNLISKKYFIRIQQPLSLLNSEPEPDVAIVYGNKSNYRENHPQTAILVVEVAISSLEIDREKAEIYAMADIPEYWIINGKDKRLEVYLRPYNGEYLEKKVIQIDQNYQYNNYDFSLNEIFYS